MEHPSHSAATAVPPALIAERQAGWNSFTQAVVIGCVSIVALLVAMLLVFRVF